MGLAVGDERRSEDVAVTGELSFAGGLLEQQLELVALFEIAVEIDLAAKDVGERHRELDVLAAFAHRGDQRRVLGVDVAANGNDVRLLLERYHLGIQDVRPFAVAIDDPQELVGVDLVLELAEETVERQDEPIRPIGAQPPRVEHGPG